MRLVNIAYAPICLLLAACEWTPNRSPCADIDCSGHGTCVVADLAGGSEPLPTCLCETGYAPTASGWLCLPANDTSLCAGLTCSGHGTCVSVKGRPTCLCEKGYTASADGSTCDDPCAGITCSGHGTCQRTSAGALCSCSAGYTPTWDGTGCEADSATYLTFVMTYTQYPSWGLGRTTLTLDAGGHPVAEAMEFMLPLGSWNDRISRATQLKLSYDGTGEQVTSLELEDQYRQGKVTRLRRASATLDLGSVTTTFQRLDKQATVSAAFSGSQRPLPMLGGFEYPGWTLGSFSPAFYTLALSRYDRTKADPQYLEVYWPTGAMIGQVKVEADAASTATKPVLRFPDYEIEVHYDDKGYPETIVLEDNDLAWSRYAGAPADLNLAPTPAATPFTPTPPPGGKSSPLDFTSPDGTKLAGTLVVPPSGSGPFPAVLMVGDLSAQDRDAPMSTLPHPLFQHLAAHLAQAGFASLRYDPRGRGQSQGSQDSLTLAQLTADVEAGLAALAQESPIDAARVFVLSHGAGAVAALSAIQAKPGAVKGYLALAPVLQQLDQATIYRATAHLEAAGFGQKLLQDQADYYQSAFAEISAGTYSDPSFYNLPLSLWKDLLAYDGAAAAVAFPNPVLALRGDQDLDFPDQLQALSDAATQAGKTNLATASLAGLTAMLVAGDKTNLLEDALLPLELPGAALNPILNWLDANK